MNENVLVKVKPVFEVFVLRFFGDYFGVCVFIDHNRRVFSIVQLRCIDAFLFCEGSVFFNFQKFLNILSFENDIFTTDSCQAYLRPVSLRNETARVNNFERVFSSNNFRLNGLFK